MSLPVKAESISMETVTYAKKGTNAGPRLDKLNPLDSVNPQKSTLLHGFSSVKQQTYGVHPLEKLDKSHHDRQQYHNFTMLRTVQGIHAPLRMLAERKAAAKVGHLPFLPRSNLMLEVLDGRDELLTPNDIFDNPHEFCEVQLPPHMTMERHAGIL